MMNVSMSEKIIIGFTLVNLLVSAFIWYGDRQSRDAVENSAQTEQIKYLTMQVQEMKDSMKELYKEVHALMGVKYSVYEWQENKTC